MVQVQIDTIENTADARGFGTDAEGRSFRDGNAVVPLTLAVIERFEAQDDYVLIHAQGRRYLVALRVANLETRLPNPPFLRVHRSHIVNLDHVERMVSLDDSRLEVRMKGGAKVPVSRIRSQEIRRRAR